MNPVPDRLKALLAHNVVTGIDFIYVDHLQTTLDVYFLRPPATLTVSLVATPPAASHIRIYAAYSGLPDVNITGVGWTVINAQDVLQITVDKPAGFTIYKLLIDDTRIDSYYNDVPFDFKTGCPSVFDCKPPAHDCPADILVDFPVDYQARDFWSFRRALLEYASLRYPDWPDRLEADAGIMLAELMSAVGDEMAYYQDRVARESYLETATQRRSIRRHARLVDYEMHDGLSATTWVDITVLNNAAGNIPAGTDVWGTNDDGTDVQFEIGQGFIDQFPLIKPYSVSSAMNSLFPHIWDETDACLPAGATEMYVEGDQTALLFPGKWVMLQTFPVNMAQQARVHLVQLSTIQKQTDPVLVDPITLMPDIITLLQWTDEFKTPFEMDLTILSVRGNLLPATEGKTFTAYFIAGATFDDLTQPEQDQLNILSNFAPVDTAVERTGANQSLCYLCSLPGTEAQPLVRLGDTDPHKALPEIHIEELAFTGGSWGPNGNVWEYRTALVGVTSSTAEQKHFTLDDGFFKRVVGYQLNGEEIIHYDYANNAGTTVRFGDGEFGLIPKGKTVFRVSYRLSTATSGNITERTLNFIENVPGLLLQVLNPLPINNGVAMETADELRQQAPDAYKAITYRAVRPEDYAEAAERLPWVQRAGAAFRYTGSWTTAFVTPDPLGTDVLPDADRQDLVNQLNRFRQAGREAYSLNPLYANIDLDIEVCAESFAFAGELSQRVQDALTQYFSPDRFTFGDKLQRSTLEETIQLIAGVKAVENICITRRGWFEKRKFLEYSYDPGMDTIIRIENNRLHPERGSFTVKICGGS